jgi:putative ABC transport system permease protein
VLGQWLDDVLRTVLLPSLIENGAIESRTLLAALAAGVVAASVAFGAGAWALPSGMRVDDLQLSDHRSRARLQSILLCVQTTVCVLLLAGTGMFARSLYRLVQQDFGMHMDNVLVVEFEQGGGPEADRGSIFADALERVRALPGVASATTFQTLPFGAHHIPPISVPGLAEPPNVGGQLPFLIAATPEFFDILGIDIVQGRKFTGDDDRGEPVVVVNQTMARGGWPNGSAVGKCIRIGFDPSFDPFTAAGPPTPSAAVPCRRIVGVARDVRQRSVVPVDNEAGLMQYYVPTSQVPGPPAGMGAMPQASGLLIRTMNEPTGLIDPIRRLVVNGRGRLPYVHVELYLRSLERQVRPWRMGRSLLGLFSILAMGVAGIGLYAAFAHAIAQRSREMAIRIAIGASPGAVMSMIVGEATRLAIVGIAAGALAAILAGRTLESVLYGFVAADPIVLTFAALVMLTIVVVATSIPAVRASRIDPNALLRAE